jgi:hypothetical protein
MLTASIAPDNQFSAHVTGANLSRVLSVPDIAGRFSSSGSTL